MATPLMANRLSIPDVCRPQRCSSELRGSVSHRGHSSRIETEGGGGGGIRFSRKRGRQTARDTKQHGRARERGTQTLTGGRQPQRQSNLRARAGAGSVGNQLGHGYDRTTVRRQLRWCSRRRSRAGLRLEIAWGPADARAGRGGGNQQKSLADDRDARRSGRPRRRRGARPRPRRVRLPRQHQQSFRRRAQRQQQVLLLPPTAGGSRPRGELAVIAEGSGTTSPAPPGGRRGSGGRAE